MSELNLEISNLNAYEKKFLSLFSIIFYTLNS
jgi:hypothetical protein